jgi:hypothetical protein
MVLWAIGPARLDYVAWPGRGLTLSANADCRTCPADMGSPRRQVGGRLQPTPGLRRRHGDARVPKSYTVGSSVTRHGSLVSDQWSGANQTYLVWFSGCGRARDGDSDSERGQHDREEPRGPSAGEGRADDHRRGDRDRPHLPPRVRPTAVRGVPPGRRRLGPRGAAALLRGVRGDRQREPRRPHPGEPDLAGEPGLGAPARVRARGARRHEPRGCEEADAAAAAHTRLQRSSTASSRGSTRSHAKASTLSRAARPRRSARPGSRTEPGERGPQRPRLARGDEQAVDAVGDEIAGRPRAMASRRTLGRPSPRRAPSTRQEKLRGTAPPAAPGQRIPRSAHGRRGEGEAHETVALRNSLNSTTNIEPSATFINKGPLMIDSWRGRSNALGAVPAQPPRRRQGHRRSCLASGTPTCGAGCRLSDGAARE